jgi:hypothetical protein
MNLALWYAIPWVVALLYKLLMHLDWLFTDHFKIRRGERTTEPGFKRATLRHWACDIVLHLGIIGAILNNQNILFEIIYGVWLGIKIGLNIVGVRTKHVNWDLLYFINACLDGMFVLVGMKWLIIKGRIYISEHQS